MTLGEKLQSCRREMALSQEALADQLGISRQTVSLWEKDQTTPTVDNLLRLCEIFGLSADELLTPDKETPPPPPSEAWRIDRVDQAYRAAVLPRQVIRTLLSALIFGAYLWLISGMTGIFTPFIKGCLTGVFAFSLLLQILRIISIAVSSGNIKNVRHEFLLQENVLYLSVWNNDRERSRYTLVPSDIVKLKKTKQHVCLIFGGKIGFIPRALAEESPLVSSFLDDVRRCGEH